MNHALFIIAIKWILCAAWPVSRSSLPATLTDTTHGAVETQIPVAPDRWARGGPEVPSRFVVEGHVPRDMVKVHSLFTLLTMSRFCLQDLCHTPLPPLFHSKHYGTTTHTHTHTHTRTHTHTSINSHTTTRTHKPSPSYSACVSVICTSWGAAPVSPQPPPH